MHKTEVDHDFVGKVRRAQLIVDRTYIMDSGCRLLRIGQRQRFVKNLFPAKKLGQRLQRPVGVGERGILGELIAERGEIFRLNERADFFQLIGAQGQIMAERLEEGD